jgi:hypothetical protein
MKRAESFSYLGSKIYQIEKFMKKLQREFINPTRLSMSHGIGKYAT